MNLVFVASPLTRFDEAYNPVNYSFPASFDKYKYRQCELLFSHLSKQRKTRFWRRTNCKIFFRMVLCDPKKKLFLLQNLSFVKSNNLLKQNWKNKSDISYWQLYAWSPILESFLQCFCENLTRSKSNWLVWLFMGNFLRISAFYCPASHFGSFDQAKSSNKTQLRIFDIISDVCSSQIFRLPYIFSPLGTRLIENALISTTNNNY